MVSTTVGDVALLKAPQDCEPILTASSPSVNQATSWTDIATLRQSVIELSEASGFAAPPPIIAEPIATVEDDFAVLVAAAVNGEREAVERVLRWVRPLVLRYCRARVGGGEKTFASADDVAQEVCLAVLTALPSYRDQGRPFLSFVYGIASHKVADAHRNAARNRADLVPELPDAPELADGPEAQVLQSEITGRMAKLLHNLPERQREVLILRVVVGLSAEETAEAVGSTPGAVRVAQHRALSRLRGILTARARSDYLVRSKFRAPEATGEITEDLGPLTEWATEGFGHDRLTAVGAHQDA
jgi:RNA polymerase sigma-70 factor (ECF subfamily)